ncbi:MAG: hypothetical protein ACPG7F_07840, partial [Aggregatilineales bacterium]
MNPSQKNALIYTIALFAFNAAMFALNLWTPLWWAAMAVNFVLIVFLAGHISKLMPARQQRNYERFLAIGFPILILIAWELIVGAEILNPRWFPPPSKIIEGMLDLTLNYDRFNKSSLIGRPWLIPEQFSEAGFEGVQSLFNESHV